MYIIKNLAFWKKIEYKIDQHTCRASAEKQAKFGGFLLLWGLGA